MPSEISQIEKDKCHVISLYVESKLKKKNELKETICRLVTARSWGIGEMNDDEQRVQVASYKMNKFWRSNIQPDDYSW